MYMLYTKGYKYRIYPNKAQVNRIENIFGCCRFVFNYFLTLRRTAWKISGQSINYVLSSRILTSLKKYRPYVFLASSDSMALQESLKDLDRAYQNFFDKRNSYPKYKSKHFHKQSYRTRNVNNCIRVEGKHLILPKVGRVKIKLSRSFKGRILNATVSRDPSGKYYVSLCVEEELIPKPNKGGMTGIDVGLHDFYVDSNGNHIPNPKPLRRYEKKLAREQRRLSRKVKGSKNSKQQRRKVSRIHEKIHSVRTDYLHKESTKLVSENQVICMETLRVKGMVRNHHLAKSVLDASWSRFFSMLKYKSMEYGCDIIQVSMFFSSSQLCSCCGYKNPEVKDLSIREWVCPCCGAEHDRDMNAAINILNEGMKLLTAA